MNRYHLLFSLLLIFGTGWVWSNRVPENVQYNKDTPRPAVGYPAPEFRLKTLDGENFALSELRGKPVVLNFWATWCGPCRNELPALQKAATRYEGEVAFVGVDQAETAETVQKYVDELGLTFTIPLDTSHDAANAFDVTLMPTTYFIDAQGTIRSVHLGEMNSITLAENIAGIR
jgi:cytochrome c biogenesis protein CcmG, thiol:disulfide interchange protein DsbE